MARREGPGRVTRIFATLQRHQKQEGARRLSIALAFASSPVWRWRTKELIQLRDMGRSMSVSGDEIKVS